MYKIYDLKTYLLVDVVDSQAIADFIICNDEWLFWIRS